ncbi:MAG: hypothetical protein IKM48_04395 [Clostridia bacterium]|nr:hypothetical protein [Clostridia bacterium]
MKNLNTKLFAFLMAACMLLTLMPFAAFAEGASVTTEYELREAAAAGGEYTVDAMIDVVDGPIVVNKDLTLYLNGDIQMMNLDGTKEIEALFIVSGATLTIQDGTDGMLHNISYAGFGSTVKLVGADTATALVSHTGCWRAEKRYIGTEAAPASLFHVEQAAGTVLPTVFLNNASYTAQTQEGTYTGALITGEDAGLSIQSGIFNTDVSKYVVEGHVCLPYYGEYNVLSLATEFSDAFTLTDKNGVLEIARYEPQTELDVVFLIDMLNNTYAYTPDGEQLYAFFAETYDTQAHTIYVSRTDSYGGLLETHLITLDFVYDAEIKEKIDALVETLPKGEYIEEEDWTLPYYYTVNDLELINYWLTCTEENDEYNVNNLINYSKELKEYIGYRNFRLDARMGGGDYFVTETAGIADFKYNGTVYASIDMGSRAEHVIYVPDDTTDLLAAARNRIDSYLGEGKVTLESEGPVIEVLWYDWYVNSQWEWGETDPDMSYEEWKESEFAPTISAADITGLEWLTDDTECFSTTINGYDYLLLAVKDSAKITDVPTYQNVDFSTEVTVLTDDPSVPLDTMIEVETLTEGEEYDHIMENLTVEEHETYDIKLYSGTKLDYVTELESGEFEVQIPVSEQLAGKELIAYYVDAEGTVAEHEVTVEEGVASFATDHFSAYTLAVKKSAAPCEHAFAWDEESKNYLCSACGAAYEQTLDIDGDGSPTTADAIMLLRAIDGGIELPLYLTDINRDGKLRIFDAVRFLQLMNA